MRMTIYVTLIVLSIGGVAIMDLSAGYGFWYWVVMTTIFGGVAIGLTSHAARERGKSAAPHVRRQLLSWLTVLAGMLLIFLTRWSLQLDPTMAGLMALLLLAVSCVLSGINGDWRLAVVGGVQAATFIAAVLAADFFWAALLIAVVGAVVMVVLSRRKSAQA